MLDDERTEMVPLPGPSAADWFAGLVTAGISGIPTSWAAPAAVLFSLITAPLLNSAREEWWEDVRRDLNELHRKIDGLTPEALSKNKVFVAAIAQATQAALRTYETEKRQALKNAVVHVAINAIVSSSASTIPQPAIRSDLELIFKYDR